MALKIRLARHGTKKRPFYRIVVADSRAPRDGRFIEKLGYFNPLLPKDHAERLKFDADRVRHWLGSGAQPTDRVARMLGAAEIIPMPAQGNNPQKAKPKAKAQERAAAKAEAAAAAAEAEAQAADEADAPAADETDAPAAEEQEAASEA